MFAGNHAASTGAINRSEQCRGEQLPFLSEIMALIAFHLRLADTADPATYEKILSSNASVFFSSERMQGEPFSFLLTHELRP